MPCNFLLLLQLLIAQGDKLVLRECTCCNLILRFDMSSTCWAWPHSIASISSAWSCKRTWQKYCQIRWSSFDAPQLHSYVHIQHPGGKEWRVPCAYPKLLKLLLMNLAFQLNFPELSTWFIDLPDKKEAQQADTELSLMTINVSLLLMVIHRVLLIHRSKGASVRNYIHLYVKTIRALKAKRKRNSVQRIWTKDSHTWLILSLLPNLNSSSSGNPRLPFDSCLPVFMNQATSYAREQGTQFIMCNVRGIVTLKIHPIAKHICNVLWSRGPIKYIQRVVPAGLRSLRCYMK
jgi:hypothetical protein